MASEIMDAERITLVYTKQVNSDIVDSEEQALIDVAEEGLLTDPETRDVLEITGCIYNDGTQKIELRAEDLELVYDFSYGYGKYKYQSFQNINKSGLSDHTPPFDAPGKLTIIGVKYMDREFPDLNCPDHKEN